MRNNYEVIGELKWCRQPSTWSQAILLVGLVSSAALASNPDESSSSNSLDLATLANLASNLGSNTQLMSMVSNLLNPKAASGVQSTISGPESQYNMAESDSLNAPAMVPSIVPDNLPVVPMSVSATTENPKRTSRQMAAAATAAAQPQPITGTVTGSSTTSSSSSGGSFSSIMSSLMPNFNLGSLSSLLGIGNKNSASKSPSGSDQTQPSSVSVSTSSSGSSSSPNTNAAQSTVNQVLSAFANGQIPNELIQLGLSGRVPPQIIELALSGQVPPQIIQMIITGQIPVSTIKSFLSSMEANSNASAGSAPAASASSATNGGSALGSASTNASSSQNKPAHGTFGLTRTIFEALFRGPQDGTERSITVPTLLGPVPIQIPSFPNVRRLGQMVGGTISNISSLLPF